MMKKRKLIFMCALLLLTGISVSADIMYQCIDEDGHKSFSNVKQSSNKGTKCTPMDLDPPPVPTTATPKPASGSGAKAPTPGNFPRVDANSQKSRDSDRRRILESELASEQSHLEQARKELTEQEALRLGNEKNYQRVLDRLEPYKAKVAQHERNIEAINIELSKLP